MEQKTGISRRATSTLTTQSGPDARAQSVGRVARLSGSVRQPNHVLANEIAGHEAERRPRAGEEWLAATQYDGMEVMSILINKTKVGQASCRAWSGNFKLPNWLCLQPTYHRLDVILDQCGVGSDRLQRARHNPLRLAAPRRRELVSRRAPTPLVKGGSAHTTIPALRPTRVEPHHSPASGTGRTPPDRVPG